MVNINLEEIEEIAKIISECKTIYFLVNQEIQRKLQKQYLFCKKRGTKIVGVCCDKRSKFEELCDKTVILPFNKEVDGKINNISTNSCMIQLNLFH